MFKALWKWLTVFKPENAPDSPRPVLPSVSPEREREVLTMVCPEVRRVLEAELESGNRTIESESGDDEGSSASDWDWPWPDSIIISLGFIFQSEPAPLPSSLDFQIYDHKKGEGDSINCVEHRTVVFAAMPTLEQHSSKTVLVGDKRRQRMNSPQ